MQSLTLENSGGITHSTELLQGAPTTSRIELKPNSIIDFLILLIHIKKWEHAILVWYSTPYNPTGFFHSNYLNKWIKISIFLGKTKYQRNYKLISINNRHLQHHVICLCARSNLNFESIVTLNLSVMNLDCHFMFWPDTYHNHTNNLSRWIYKQIHQSNT